jgi:elongation factor G
MKVYDAANVRNVALVGHSGSGKTQLAAALLFDAAAVNRFGKVDDGTTVTDSDEEEIARKHTLSASLAWCEWNKTKVNLLDTPGMANFLSDARAALRVADAAIVVLDAVSGAEVQTEKVWHEAEALGLPKLVVLNRLDRERASVDRALASVREACSRIVTPIHIPIGEERGFRGIVDLVTMKAYTYASDGSGKGSEGDIPPDMADAATTAREALIEMVAEADDALMERFFEVGTLTQEELVTGLRKAALTGKIAPLVCASAVANIGIPLVLDAIVNYLPSPAERPFKALDAATRQEIARETSATAPYAAFVWKTVADPFAGRITLFRVMMGTVKADSTVFNLTRETPERLGHLSVMQGKTATNVPELRAGDLGAVAKLKDTLTNDTLAEKSTGVVFAPIPFPAPVLSYAIEPKSRGDEDKISTSMHRLEEEDPTIRYMRDPQTKELLLAGQGQLHIEVTVAKLKRRFGVEVNLKPPRIPYRETITAPTEAHGRHKKQTGGHGQFGDCKIRLEPLPRGAEFVFEDDIFGGSIPRQFVPAVEKGIQDARLRGYLAGYPVVDFKATVYDGSFHPVDSNELSFKLAGSLAFKDGMSRARPTILEPVMNVEIHAPSDYAGDLMGDLNSRRGRISGMDSRSAMTVIRAQVPMAEMLTYEQHLTSVTGGRGTYNMEYSHYDEVPQHLQTKIIAVAKAERAGEEVEEV